MNKNSKIYIAGHLGLVGSAIWKNLQSKGYTNLIGKTIDELNLLDEKSVAAFFEQEKPEYVFLAAAKVGGIIANNTYRGQFIYENLMIQNHVIHQSYLHGVKKLLFLGSTCIYPREAPQPMPEDCLLTSPLEYTNEPYAIAKIAGIKLCESYNLQYGTNFISVMPTNLYGPNDNFDLEKSHVFPALIRKIHLAKCLEENNWEAIKKDLDKRPIEGISSNNSTTEIRKILYKYGVIMNDSEGSHDQSYERTDSSSSLGMTKQKVQVEIWGTGTPMREFLWSEEMADACVFIMEKVNFDDVIAIRQQAEKQSVREKIASFPTLSRNDAQTKEIRNTHINIGTGKEISIRNLAELIQTVVGFKGELFFNADKPDGTMRKLTDPSKIHALGWHHHIDMEEGVKKMYEWYVASLH